MASSAQIPITAATATQVAFNGQHDDEMQVEVQVSTAAFLGGPGVSPATGYAVAANAPFRMELAGGDSLWAYAAGAATVSIITSP